VYLVPAAGTLLSFRGCTGLQLQRLARAETCSTIEVLPVRAGSSVGAYVFAVVCTCIYTVQELAAELLRTHVQAACGHAYVRACVRACVFACVRICARVRSTISAHGRLEMCACLYVCRCERTPTLMYTSLRASVQLYLQGGVALEPLRGGAGLAKKLGLKNVGMLTVLLSLLYLPRAMNTCSSRFADTTGKIQRLGCGGCCEWWSFGWSGGLRLAVGDVVTLV